MDPPAPLGAAALWAKQHNFSAGVQPPAPPGENMKYTFSHGWQPQTFIVTLGMLNEHAQLDVKTFDHWD